MDDGRKEGETEREKERLLMVGKEVGREGAQPKQKEVRLLKGLEWCSYYVGSVFGVVFGSASI